VRILVHDYSGHPFQAELSRELARRGHDVVHSYKAAYVSGKGNLVAEPGETVTFQALGPEQPLARDRFVRRLLHELRDGLAMARHVRDVRPDVTLLSNVQVPTLTVLAFCLMLTRRPWVLWHQDVHSHAVQAFARTKLSPKFRLVGWAFEAAEAWCARRAAAVVGIAPAFVGVHERWGTAQKLTVIPNWAPLAEIVPTERKNDWAVEHGLDHVPTLLYSGTLGLKHTPDLLVRLASAVRDAGAPVQLVVVNEGPAVEVIEQAAAQMSVPVTMLPYQPYDRLPEVLGTGDVLLVLLDRSAGEFSVPSKTLSYLCAGRPVLGLMPQENQAAELVERAGGRALPPEAGSLDEAARWIADVLADNQAAQEIGRRSRLLAEDEFALDSCADRFETILRSAQ
jgi:glycosyltransferase involved in cell wall biosynthesis